MKKVVLSSIVAAALLGSGAVAKESATKSPATVAQVNQEAVQNAKEQAKNAQDTVKLVQEAIESLRFAHDALIVLDKGDTKTAKSNIEKALGKLETILASKKVPELLPIDTAITAKEFLGGYKDVKKAIKEVEKLLDDGKVQEARLALEALQSHIEIHIVNLPLGTYPDALKLVAKHIVDGNLEAAKVVLASALSTFVEVTQIVPLPIVKAHDLIVAAELIAPKDKETAITYLAAAKEQLKLAEALGYVSDSDVTYKALEEAIEKVEDEIKGSNKPAELFKKLKEKLKNFSDKIVSPKEPEENKK